MKTETLLVIAAIGAVGYLLYTKSKDTPGTAAAGTQSFQTSSQTGGNQNNWLTTLETRGTEELITLLGGWLGGGRDTA